MIDARTADAYEALDARSQELFHAYTPGFVPTLRATRVPSGTVRVDFVPNKLDAAAPEGTYFVGDDQHGRRFYSRNGVFHFNNGILQTQNGSTVVGFPAPDGSGRLGPLREDPVDVALRRCSDEHIESDGTVAYTRKVVDPKSGVAKTERVVVGRLALSRFPAGTELDSADGVHLTAPAGVEPTIGAPSENAMPPLLTQRIDRGSYNVKEGLAELRDAYVNFDGLRAATTAEGSLDKQAMDLLK